MTQPMQTSREILQITPGVAATDGDGVKMTRIIGSQELNVLDPFLLLDAFESDHPDDYIGGFPSHPHRGFETVTYLLAGRMRHKDNAGNEGVIEPGGVQWMTAGNAGAGEWPVDGFPVVGEPACFGKDDPTGLPGIPSGQCAA